MLYTIALKYNWEEIMTNVNKILYSHNNKI